MDPISTLKSDFFRPIATLFVPGFMAPMPFLLIVADSFGVDPLAVVDRRPVPTAILLFAIFLVGGFALENVGSLYEHFVIDKRLKRRFLDFDQVWDKYLCMRIKDEVIGQRYLQTIRLRFKFELSMAPALVLSAIGVGCLNSSHNFLRWWPTFHIFVLVVAATVAYLLYEAYRSALVLDKTRRLLVHHISPPSLATRSTPSETSTGGTN